MDKIELFKNELFYIKNEKIKEFTIQAIQLMPDYFFSIPASSTGKYHPAYSLGEGGLYRHTRAAIRIAVELFRIEGYNFTSDEKDLILASLFVHDGWKSGILHETYTRADHPVIAFSELNKNENLKKLLSSEQFAIFLNNILTHMGGWNKDFKTGQEVMPKPLNEFQKFVHLADYLASRKCLEMNFDIPLSVE